SFFFSSRRRHTRLVSDWSSDVCSSDLNLDARQIGGIRLDRIFMAVDAVTDPTTGRTECNVTLKEGKYPDCVPLNLFGRGKASTRSEERRVGEKERTRRAAGQ